MTLKFILISLVSSFFASMIASAEKPNILFIMLDDTGYETLSSNGALNFKTPNIDKLATESTVFTQADSTPLCCPTRTRFITGRYTHRAYIGWDGRFKRDATLLPQLLQKAGYATGAYGKWHLGVNTTAKFGFDDYCQLRLNELKPALMQTNSYWDAPYDINGKKVTAPYGPDLSTEQAIKFIRKNKDRPFFVYYTPWLAHNPFEPTPDSKDRNSKDWQQNFEDMVAYSDKLIGKLLAELKTLGIYDNTIIIFTADNGTKTCAHHMQDGTTIYGGKGILRVDGVHVPLTVKTDGTHRTSDALVDFADFYPTFAELAGIPSNKIHPAIDGISFAPALKGNPDTLRKGIFNYHNAVSVRDQTHKLYHDQRLYDIAADPRELRPFYPQTDTPETAAARKKLEQFRSSVIHDKKFKSASQRRKVQQLLKHSKGKLNSHLLGTREFDGFKDKPKSITFTDDATAFVTDKAKSLTVRYAREPGSHNSGLHYANAKIDQVAVLADGKPIATVSPKNTTLTTRPKAKVINPMVDFIYDEKNSKITFKDLNIPAGTKQLTIKTTATLTNPGNPWGDRIRLNTFIISTHSPK